MEIDHTITRCEQSRREQSLLQDEMSEQNRDQEYARHGRIAEKSSVKGRRTFKKNIDWRLWGSNFILPGLECPDSLQLWRQRREVPRCWEWRRAHQKFAGFTTVPTGVRSKCWTFASLSLWTRKLGVQFISRSDKCRETCRVVFKPKSVESRNVFRQRGFSL